MSERDGEQDAPESWWRVTVTHGAIVKVNTARRKFRCEGHIAPVSHFIHPGEQYVRTSLPPNNREINNDAWWHMRLCWDCCPAKYDTRVTPTIASPRWEHFDGTPCPNADDTHMCGEHGQWTRVTPPESRTP